MAATHILVVEDEAAIRDMLAFTLEAAGFEVSLAANAEQAQALLRARLPDLVLLDWMLPGRSGLELCRRIRRDPELRDLPVVMLTARGEETDRVRGLEDGADDYVTKPFNPRELLARIKAVLRRVNSLPPARERIERHRLRFGDWIFDPARRELLRNDGVTVPLSTAEYQLLLAFVRHPGMVLSRDQLLDLARGREAQLFDRSIDNLVSRLRKKIEQDPRRPRYIKTHWGGGYSFAAEVKRA